MCFPTMRQPLLQVAHVGSRSIDDQWWYERGPFGYGELNKAGEELLSFLATNGGTVCNTWFKEKEINKQTCMATFKITEVALYWLCDH